MLNTALAMAVAPLLWVAAATGAQATGAAGALVAAKPMAAAAIASASNTAQGRKPDPSFFMAPS